MAEKAAIITWCYDNGRSNYGQILQCYAMQQICNKMGYQPIVVKYRRKTERERIKHRLPIAFLNHLYEKRFVVREVEKDYNKRIELFFRFIKHNINLSNPCYTIADLEQVTKDCNILLCGSDQIWNPIWFSPVYALNFGTENQKRIAYAPSGIAIEDEASKKKYRELAVFLERFDAISVREKIGADILRKYTGREIVDVLDPTFLLNHEDWDLVASDKLVNRSYIFCYTLGSIRPYKLLLKQLMKRYQVSKVVFIPSNVNECGTVSYGEFQKLENIGPAEFLSLIKYARAVCTDSFHGMALSINYRKQFCLLERAQRGSSSIANEARMLNIIDKLHLNNRSVRCIKDIDLLPEIDYSKLDGYLDESKKKSWEFLKNAID